MLRKNVLFFGVTALAAFYLLWRLIFTLPFEYGFWHMFWGVILWLCELFSALEALTHFANARKHKAIDMPEITKDMYPDVDLFVCTHNEDRDLLFKTLNGCQYIDYPDKNKVHIYLCDDGNRPEIRELAESMERVHYIGYGENEHAKAGNINHAMSLTTSPLIAIFDADMIPTHNFLTETVPYFFMEKMIKDQQGWRLRREDEPYPGKPLAFVQTRQSFYNLDPIQKNLFAEKYTPNEQDYFFRSVNVARTDIGAAMFAGTNALFLRKAFEDVGGMETYSVTEDLATTISMLDKGYYTIAVDKELAHGLSPEDTSSLLKQRKRWSKGTAQVLIRKQFFKAKMSLLAKWNFFISYVYWWGFFRKFIAFLCPLLYALGGIIVAKVTFPQLILIWLPYFLLYNKGVSLMSGGTTNELWANIKDTVQFPYLMWPIISGTLKIPEKKFHITPKEKVIGKNSDIRLATPYFILLFFSLISIIICGWYMFQEHGQSAIIVLAWLLYNTFSLLCAIVYYDGHIDYRRHEWLSISVPARIRAGKTDIEVVTEKLSEQGMTVITKKPVGLSYKVPFDVYVDSDRYPAVVHAVVREVTQTEQGWKYELRIKEMEEAEKSKYYQNIYDRKFDFPQVISITMSRLVKLILAGMTKKRQSDLRKLPRIHLDKTFESPKVGAVHVLEFNYNYIVVQKMPNLTDSYSIRLNNEIQLQCRLRDNIHGKGNKLSYAIENWEEIAVDPQLQDFLYQMSMEGQNEKQIANPTYI